MNEYEGWLLDVYAGGPEGIILWLLGGDGRRCRFRQHFPITFYAAGPQPRLHQAWHYLHSRYTAVTLSYSQRTDLFTGQLNVLTVQIPQPSILPAIFHALQTCCPDLDYYDADIPLPLRYAATYNLFPLAYCRLTADETGQIQTILPLESPWAVEPSTPPLRLMHIEPNCDPGHAEPAYLTIRSQQQQTRLPLHPRRLLPVSLHAAIQRHDPDLILTRWGDTWLFPLLQTISRQHRQHRFNPNRDQSRQPFQRPSHSYFTYGQVVYRGQQTFLFGRWHIDQQNSVMFGDYGLAGILEQARVTGLPVQEVARKSPGAGITAMQIQTALRQGILVPHQKQQAEAYKSARDLLRSDRGGLVYQPLIGVHRDVAEIDFISMYPSIMVRFNVSPETVGKKGPAAQIVPELGVPIDQSRAGLVPRTLQPLLAKRIAIKQQLAALERRDCRYQPLKARAAALKWLLVVCFGYLGYKNARFGRIESHEAVTAYGREALLRAKETAEEMGFTVLHMYVDGLWVKREAGNTSDMLPDLLEAITAHTGLPIALEGVYRWIAFLPSRLDTRVPVPNRYFGVFQDGRSKTRGIELRRHDTPLFIAKLQTAVLQHLARTDTPPALLLPALVPLLRRYLAALRTGQIPLEQLLITQRLSRTLDVYRTPSPAARAAAQLAAAGKQRRPGQGIRFLYTRDPSGVCAWDLPEPPPVTAVDVERYTELLLRAVYTLLQPFGIEEKMLRDWVKGNAYQMHLPLAARQQ